MYHERYHMGPTRQRFSERNEVPRWELGDLVEARAERCYCVRVTEHHQCNYTRDTSPHLLHICGNPQLFPLALHRRIRLSIFGELLAIASSPRSQQTRRSDITL